LSGTFRRVSSPHLIASIRVQSESDPRTRPPRGRCGCIGLEPGIDRLRGADPAGLGRRHRLPRARSSTGRPHIFATGGDFILNTSVEVMHLVVVGGGGAGGGGGGGGAGGPASDANPGWNGERGAPGASSSVFGVVASGGGAGGAGTLSAIEYDFPTGYGGGRGGRGGLASRTIAITTAPATASSGSAKVLRPSAADQPAGDRR